MVETSQPQEDSEDTWKKDVSTATGPTHRGTSGARQGEEDMGWTKRTERQE